MDERYLYLHAKYRQEVPGCGPWPFISTLPDDELRADLEVAHALRDEYGPSTTEGAMGGGSTGVAHAGGVRTLSAPRSRPISSSLTASAGSTAKPSPKGSTARC